MKRIYKKRPQRRITSETANVAAGIGIGILAGLAGTAVMTAAQMIEMKITGRKGSYTPYNAIEKTFGVEAKTEDDKEILNTLTHFTYGTIWGIPRGISAVSGAGGAAGTTAHFAAIWGTELTVLPALDIIEPVTTWQPKVTVTDAFFHSIYALAAGITADVLAQWLKQKKKKKLFGFL